jgi:PAS domain S-box-containing protein
MVESQMPNLTTQNEQEFIANFLHNIDVLVIILDGNGSLISFNKACERLFGYTSDEIRSKLQTGILPLPGGRIGEVKNILRLIRYANDNERHETEWPTKQGEVCTILWSVKSVFDNNGLVEYIIATGTDITNMKIAEEKLLQEKILLRSLINSFPDLIFYKDVDGVYLGCNQAFEAFSGHTIQGAEPQHTLRFLSAGSC